MSRKKQYLLCTALLTMFAAGAAPVHKSKGRKAKPKEDTQDDKTK